MDIELVSKPARELLNNLIKYKDDEDCVSGLDYPELVDIDNCWFYELEELEFITSDHVPNAIITNKGLTYPERRKAYIKEMMLTSFWLPVLVALVVSILTSTITIHLIQQLIDKINK